ncbi:MAG: tRNA 2-thiocytidine biosynthesis protein TtcA [Bacilli bacterium]|nr:tRNA 2-thiocytidine biosynthesis protein TtcA [Bacilli bacterium]
MEYKDIERSIIKKFRKEIWSKFVKAINDYELIKENDKIMVCISGGKDSFLLAKLMQEILRHGKLKFECFYVVMNPGYKKEVLKKIVDNSKLLNIPIEIFDTDIFEVANKLNPEHPCYMCARMRRGYLYSKAKELGCNKIALGHHFDDVIETTLLNMFYASEVKTMMPKLHSDNFEGMELIRPMYLIKEMDIISWTKYNKLEFINCACAFTNKGLELGKRNEIKELIKELRKKNKDIDYNIFKSMSNINLDAILAYHSDEKNYNFLDDYDK